MKLCFSLRVEVFQLTFMRGSPLLKEEESEITPPWYGEGVRHGRWCHVFTWSIRLSKPDKKQEIISSPVGGIWRRNFSHQSWMVFHLLPAGESGQAELRANRLVLQ